MTSGSLARMPGSLTTLTRDGHVGEGLCILRYVLQFRHDRAATIVTQGLGQNAPAVRASLRDSGCDHWGKDGLLGLRPDTPRATGLDTLQLRAWSLN